MNSNLVWVKTKCDDYYKLIRKIENIKIRVYEIRYDKKVLYLKIDRKSLEKLDKYLISYKFKLDKKIGLDKVFAIINREKIFLISLVLGIILFIILNNMVFKINIVHENKYIRELLKDELDSYGVKVLHFKKSYKEMEKIKQEILDKYPDSLDWMEFEVKGMVINVKVEERIITDTKSVEKTCNIVAKKAGVISDIKVIQGESLVAINDYVNKGDILISGEVKYNEETKRYTCASGEVYATTWYIGKASIPFNYDEYTETGKKKYNLIFENDGNKKEIFRNRFKDYKSNLKTILKIFDFKLYVDKQMEVKKITKKYTEEEAINEGVKKVVENIEKKSLEKDSIIDKKVLKKSVNDSTMDIDVFVVLKELISAEKEVVIGEGID